MQDPPLAGVRRPFSLGRCQSLVALGPETQGSQDSSCSLPAPAEPWTALGIAEQSRPSCPMHGGGPASPPLRQEDVVHAAQFDIDLQTEVGQGLRRGPLHVLHLHALRGHAQHGISHTLDLSCQENGVLSTAPQRSSAHPTRHCTCSQARDPAPCQLQGIPHWPGEARSQSGAFLQLLQADRAVCAGPGWKPGIQDGKQMLK